MADFDKVVKGLENCLDNNFNCRYCKYHGKCEELNRDALELLKECKDCVMQYVYKDIYDAADGLESAARYLEFSGYSEDDSMVNITTERHEGRVKIKFAIGQPNAAQWVWTIQEQKKVELPDLTDLTDLTEYHESDYEKLKYVYDLLGLGVAGGEITKDSLRRAAEKFDEK